MLRLSPVALACAVAVVDQLDGAVALVELPNGAVTTVPLAHLPPGVEEGESLCAVPTRRSRRGARRPYTFTRARRAQPGERDD